MKYSFILILLFFTSCFKNDIMLSNKIGNELFYITEIELINKLNLNEKQVLKYLNNNSFQINGIVTEIASPRTKPIMYDEIGNLIENPPITSYIAFGYEECGWIIFFYFNGIISNNLKNGDHLTIQGNFEKINRWQGMISKNITDPINDNIRYIDINKDIIYINFIDCIVIEKQRPD